MTAMEEAFGPRARNGSGDGVHRGAADRECGGRGEGQVRGVNSCKGQSALRLREQLLCRQECLQRPELSWK